MYQIVGMQRTKTTLLSFYLREYYQKIGIENYSEIFLSDYYVDNDKILIKPIRTFSHDNKYEINSKLDFLESNIQRNVHYHFKVFPAKIKDKKQIERLTNILNNYKIITIDRNPFDSLLSYLYQQHTYWSHSHRSKNTKLFKDRFVADTSDISCWIKDYKDYKKFLTKLNYIIALDYDDVNREKIQKLLGCKLIKPDVYEPMNIDYKDIIINIDEIKHTFDYEMNEKTC